MLKKLYIIISILFFGCNSQLDSIFCYQNNEYYNGHRTLIVSKEEAAEYIQDFLSESNLYSRSVNSHRKVKEIYTWKKQKEIIQNSASEDPAFYVIQFENNMGYAIISADKRTDDRLYAIIDEGTFSPTIFENIDGASDYTKTLEYLYSKQIEKFNNEAINSIEVLTITENNPIITDEWKTVFRLDPLIKVNWGQYAPYNKFCITDSGQQSLTGCVPVAIAQIMSYHKYPTSYANHNYSWNNITSTTSISTNSPYSDCVAHLMSDIGRIMGTKYHPTYASTHTNNANMCFDSMGYSNSGTALMNLDINKLTMSLLYGCPVLMRGNTAGGNGGGHAWVVDGILTRKTDNLTYKTQAFIHCNWGWNATANGYYLVSGVDTIAPKNNSSTIRVFDNLQIITNIHR